MLSFTRIVYFLLVVLIPQFATAQSDTDTLTDVNKIASPVLNHRFYLEKNGDSFYCEKPRFFDFFTNIPKNGAGYFRQSFQQKNLYKLGIVAASTAVLIIFDQQITDEFQRFTTRNGIRSNEDFKPIVTVKLFGKKTNLGKWPRNVNTAFYNIGQGSSVVLMAAGFFIGGKLKHDNRALQTATQLGESFLALGFGTQVMKYATGRENPSDASVPGGRWRPFPSFSNFQNSKPKYDAFPSGHLATFVSAVTIISENYPTKKWIKPVGYTISGLLGLSMLNNGVHWAGDFPLGFALGYGYGKYIAKKNKKKIAAVAW